MSCIGLYVSHKNYDSFQFFSTHRIAWHVGCYTSNILSPRCIDHYHSEWLSSVRHVLSFILRTHMRVPQISEHQICFSLTADSVNLSGWRFNLSSDLKEHTQIILSRIHMLIAFTKIRRKNLRNSFISILLFVFFTSSFHLRWSLSVHNLINWT